VEARVLGCLIEKELTTPEYYPLTLKALNAACNQKSSRDPVMDLDETAVLHALDELRCTHHLAWQVTTSAGHVPRFKHDLLNAVALSPPELAIVCALLLRGAQTPGELRIHAGRMHPFGSVAEVENALSALAGRDDGPCVLKLPRETGWRELRYTHRFCGDVRLEEVSSTASPQEAPAGTDRVEALESRVAALEDQLNELKARLAEFGKPG
jgi:uncharacterized protein YceH (UPF0502 family)